GGRVGEGRPRRPRAPAEKWRAHPQRSACRDSLTVPIRRPSPSRSCRSHRARSRHPSHRRLVTFLTEPEISALLAAPDRSTWTGRRDHTLFSVAAQTGLRASELIGLRCADVHLAAGAHVSCQGKGRKQRITTLTSGLVCTLRVWLVERDGPPGAPLFVTHLQQYEPSSN